MLLINTSSPSPAAPSWVNCCVSSLARTDPIVINAADPGSAAQSRSDGMTKSELIEKLAAQQQHLSQTDVDLAVRSIIEQMSSALASGDRIEIRGFGSFCLHFRPPRIGRNPKTGDSVALPGKHVPHFKPGKELRERVNQAAGD
ncbi:MAG TPA: integration host factor subunit beta [Wenzhouxiangellaceae bacterium]|nr:integration host factor subunit beta [Wenzhouxiangellaceae bacterium]